MIVHTFLQGSPEWHAHRATARNASDAAVIMGCDPHRTRDDWLRERYMGIGKEHSQYTEEKVFAKGHAIEAKMRPVAEAMMGEDLGALVGSNTVNGIELSASFDGLTMMQDRGWECKSLNEELRKALTHKSGGCLPTNNAKNLPKRYQVQMQQQIMVSGCERILFTASDGDGDERHCWYANDAELGREIIAAWKQADIDLANYAPSEVAAPVVAKTVSALPVVFDMRVEGKLVSCNISAYKPAALAYIEAINADLVTDQDFADADKDAKYCRESAKKLGLSIEQALGQMGDINEAIGIVREIAATFDAKGLMLEKLVKSEKESRKLAIVNAGRDAFAAHFSALNTRLGKPYMPTIAADFAGVTKGLKTVASMENAVNTELARAKIEANAVADKIQANMVTLVELGSDYKFLFGDTATIVLKANDDLTALVKTRIAEHQAAEAVKEEATRQRIRAEEQAKAESEARAKLAAEQAAELAEAQRMSAIFEAQNKFAAQVPPVSDAKQLVAAPAVAAFVAKPADKTVSAQTVTRADVDAAIDATHADYYPQILVYLRNLTEVTL
jgi:predicted phage-related endonuclease